MCDTSTLLSRSTQYDTWLLSRGSSPHVRAPIRFRPVRAWLGRISSPSVAPVMGARERTLKILLVRIACTNRPKLIKKKRFYAWQEPGERIYYIWERRDAIYMYMYRYSNRIGFWSCLYIWTRRHIILLEARPIEMMSIENYRVGVTEGVR